MVVVTWVPPQRASDEERLLPASDREVELLSRPLLEALQELTGLASSYLTVIWADDGVQEIRYSHNSRAGFAVPEGLLVPWEDTLCKRALDEGRPLTVDVPTIWGDSQAAADLGIEVYLSVPVELSDGRVWGTLCAADSRPAQALSEHVPTMRVFARLIASAVEREGVVATERARAVRARAEADTDALTGCADRRVVEPWLAERLAALPDGHELVVVYADVDRFKSVNDTHGHTAGDRLLVEAAQRLRSAARPEDLVARLGGDEFLTAAVVPVGRGDALEARLRDALSFSLPHDGGSIDVRLSVGMASATGGDVMDLVAAADAAMYQAKSRGAP